jgi:nucleoid DNA-binding protein/cell division septation protein DedD
MEKKIKEYLLRNKKLIINNIGVFEIVYKPSEIHPILHTLTVPGNYAVFVEDKNVNDNEFAVYVASQEKISEEQAAKRIDEWVEKVRKTIEKKEDYVLSTLGKFFIDAMGRIAFLPALDIDISPQSFGLEHFTTAISCQTTKEVKPEVVPESKNTAPPTLPQQEATKEEIRDDTKEAAIEKEDDAEEIEDGFDSPKPKKRKPVRALLIALCVLILCSGAAVSVAYYFYPHILQTHCGSLYEFIHEKINLSEKTITEPETEAVTSAEQSSEEAVLMTEDREVQQELENSEKSQGEETKQLVAEPVEENTSLNEPQNAVQKGSWYLVLGSFEEKTNAEAFLLDKQSEYPNVVNLGQGKTSGMYLIAIGPYTQQEAQQQLNKGIKAWLFKK